MIEFLQTHDLFTFSHILRMGLELFLGICIKLLCDNGRISWQDFVNDFLTAWPLRKPTDGLSLEAGVDPYIRDQEKDIVHTNLIARNFYRFAMVCAAIFITVAFGIMIL